VGVSANQKKVLLVTHYWEADHFGGRQALSRINEACLESILGDNLLRYHIKPESGAGVFRKFYELVNLRVDGLTREVLLEILELIETNNVEIVYLDGSTLGTVAKFLDKEANVTVATFFHHHETTFFYQLFAAQKSVKALMLFIAVFFVEKFAINYSRLLLILTERDREKILKGVKQKETYILPMVVNQPVEWESTVERREEDDPYVLFVGGGKLLGNHHGIDWFLANVSSQIPYKSVVIGSDYDDLESEYSNNCQVTFKGRVDDLSSYYVNATAVVCPVFYGSGMKTKVAEALMYGKYVFGTDEAFIGYEGSIEKVGVKCESAVEFVDAIGSFEYTAERAKGIKREYVLRFSGSAQLERFKEILETLQS